MKFSTLYSPNIMYILTANQNVRVTMAVYYAHCDWLNAGWLYNAVLLRRSNGYNRKTQQVTQLIEKRVSNAEVYCNDMIL